MGRRKAQDEVFCTACGARIKRAAARCPHCGVANEWQDPSATADSTSTAQSTSPAQSTRSGAEEPAEDRPRTEGTGRSVPEQRTPSEVQAARDGDGGSTAAAAGAGDASATDAGSGTRTATSAPREGDGVPSADWWYGVATAGVAWVVVLGAWAAGVQHGGLGALALLAWAGLPVSISRDARFVRARSDWEPSGGPWAFAALVPVLNLVVALIYLVRRHEVLGTP